MTAVWNDDAITSAHEDKFGRAGWAAKQAKLIVGNHSVGSSLVYGLEGPWGSGKSSVLSMVEDALGEIDDSWHVVYFTPWATTTHEELFSEFFAALTSAVPAEEGYKPLLGKLGAYGKVAIPLLGAVPVVGSALADSVDRLSAKMAKPWKMVFSELAQSLKDAGLKILVVVDDIDRLSPDELLTLLKVIRLIGRLPGIDYLLAYDEKTLAETLTAARLTNAISTTHARQFMEKIVQYPLQLPPLLESVTIRLLIDGLNELPLTDRSVAALSAEGFQGVLADVMLSRLSTPRAMGRFLAQLKHTFDVVDQDEFHASDLVLVAFMRLHFPDMHRALPNWRAELTGQGTVRTYKAAISKDPEEKDAWKHEFFETVEALDKDDAARLASGIFSRLTLSAGGGIGSAEDTVDDAPNRMENQTYFDRYIVFEVPDGDVPDGVLTAALNGASDGDIEPLRELVMGDDNDKSMLVITRIDKRYSQLVPRGQTTAADAPVSVNILKAAATLLDGVPDSDQEILSGRRFLSKWAATVLRLLAETAEVGTLQQALDSCGNYAKRIEVLWKLKNERILTEAATTARDRLFDLEGERAAQVVLDHLAAGDDADLKVFTTMLLTVILESASSDKFSKEVQERIAAGTLDLPTVASRCVQFDWSREQYVLDNGKLQQLTEVYVDPASEYVGTSDDSPAPVWTIRQRREWVEKLLRSKDERQAGEAEPQPDQD